MRGLTWFMNPTDSPASQPAPEPLPRRVSWVRRFWPVGVAVVGIAAYVLISGRLGLCPMCVAVTDAVGLGAKPVPANVANTVPAPAWKLTTLDGAEISGESLRGKVVVLNFWATWCPPCRKEIPDFVDLQREWGERGLVFIGVSMDHQGEAVVRAFADQYGINYPVAMGDQRIAEAFGGVEGLPTTFIIDRQGGIVARQVGYAPRAAFEKAIGDLL